jgi:hypothetical protein
MVKLVRSGIMGEFLCPSTPSWYGTYDRGDFFTFSCSTVKKKLYIFGMQLNC